MSKRTFSDFEGGVFQDIKAVSHLVQAAEELLKAAVGLKKELETSGQTSNSQSRHRQAVANASSKVLPVIERFGQDPSDHRPHPSKTVKLTPATVVSLSPWSNRDIPPPKSLPPPLPTLPPILDPALEEAAFTHSGMISSNGLSYERLEWLGDAYLYLISSALIYQTFPDLSTGRCAQLREICVKNMTLSKFTLGYGLEARLNFPPELGVNSASVGQSAKDKNRRKVLGDVFEAYVAAAILSDPGQGLSRVAEWLKTLWAVELADNIRTVLRKTLASSLPLPAMNGQSSSPASAAIQPQEISAAPATPSKELPPKDELRKRIGTRGCDFEYRDVRQPGKEKKSGLPWYTVGVWFSGLGETKLQLGIGHGLSKKDAGGKAAQQALGNKRLMNRLEEKKRDAEAAARAATAGVETGAA